MNVDTTRWYLPWLKKENCSKHTFKLSTTSTSLCTVVKILRAKSLHRWTPYPIISIFWPSYWFPYSTCRSLLTTTLPGDHSAMVVVKRSVTWSTDDGDTKGINNCIDKHARCRWTVSHTIKWSHQEERAPSRVESVEVICRTVWTQYINAYTKPETMITIQSTQ